MSFEKTLQSLRKEKGDRINRSEEKNNKKDKEKKQEIDMKRKKRERNKKIAEQFAKEHEGKFLPILEQLKNNFIDLKSRHHLSGGPTYGSGDSIVYAEYELSWELPSRVYWGLVAFTYYPDGKIALTIGDESFGPFLESDSSWQEKCQDLILKAIELRAYKIRVQP